MNEHLQRISDLVQRETSLANDKKNAILRSLADAEKTELQNEKIEIALELVRARTLAMRKSNELAESAQVVFQQLANLGNVPARITIGIPDEHTGLVDFWVTDQVGNLLNINFKGRLDEPTTMARAFDAWRSGSTSLVIELEGQELTNWIRFVREELGILVTPEFLKDKRVHSIAFFTHGWIMLTSHELLSINLIRLLERFAAVFNLTYTRFLDLQKAEEQARKAQIEASLDRIRAEIASMRTVSDLERITPLIWNELTIIGVPFVRCGVFIMDEKEKHIHTFLSTPDGKAIGAFHLPYETAGAMTQVLVHWQQKETYKDHWDQETFTEFANALVEKGALSSADQYLKSFPPGGFYLHFLPFLQGMLYVGNTTVLDDEEIASIQSVADAFSTAYARYEDFNRLEAAKQQVERTLADLKQAQAQLIQAEKMASLGELTAGIAHEIQNPLNFVNNFSEVNTELLEELKNQTATSGDDGQPDEELLQIIIENEKKINHHGKRADAIVKGMLQHSRSSSSAREPTDINALADEYLRLAYHGLRGKDKTFNASMVTHFDETIGPLQLIPQDIGRVFLNLYNNAFYAVNEKKEIRKQETHNDEQQTDVYEPTVTVSTRLQPSVSGKGFTVVVSVKDNGIGIPKKITDKIFQPFFTTKPTGKGTGLGLSLAYDIVKAHGGELKVETSDSGGANFIVVLPG